MLISDSTPRDTGLRDSIRYDSWSGSSLRAFKTLLFFGVACLVALCIARRLVHLLGHALEDLLTAGSVGRQRLCTQDGMFTQGVQMDDTDTAAIELTEGEAREVINALSTHLYKVSGRDEQRTLDAREFLKREFGFKEEHFEDDTDLFDVIWPGDDDGEHEIQLSRVEAAEIVPALADLEADADPQEAQTIADLRNRFAETFDLEDGPAT